VAAVVVALLLAVAAIGVARGVTLPGWAVERVEAGLRGRTGDAPRLSLGRVRLDYDWAARALRLSLRDASLVEAAVPEGEAPRLTLPRLDVALDAAALVSGRIRPRSVTVGGAALRVARDEDGSLDLVLGGGDGAVELPRDWGEGLATLDALLAWPPLSGLDAVEATGIAIIYVDRRTGAAQELQDGRVLLSRGGASTTLELFASLPAPGVAPAQASLALRRGADGLSADAALTGLPLGRVAELVPEAPALSVVAGTVDLRARMALDGEASPGPLQGEVSLADGRLALARPVAFDRARLAFSWQPGSGIVAVEDVRLGSDALSTGGAGQVILEDGLRGAAQLQLALGPTLLAPEGVFDREASFESGLLEARILQSPLSLRIGQLSLAGDSGTAQASGRFHLTEGGVEGALDARAARLDVDQVLGLWPTRVAPRTRDWALRNLIAGEAIGAAASIRLEPGIRPVLAAGFGVEAATVRFLRDMPPVEDAEGWFQIQDDAMSVRVDAGTVPGVTLAAGPAADGEATPGPATAGDDRVLAPGAGRVDMAGTTFTIGDVRVRPPRGLLELEAEGEIADVLRLLDNPPLRLLARTNRDAGMARGRARIVARVETPLKRGTVPAEVDYEVTGELIDVRSDVLVPGRQLLADRLALEVTPEAARIAGGMSLDGVRGQAEWVQPLPPPRAGPRDPDAPRVPAPPGRVQGTVRITPDGLSRLGIALGAVEVSGETEASFDVALGRGPPRIAITSDLRGAGLALRAVGWRKPPARAGRLGVEAVLEAPPRIEVLDVEAPGLAARGSIRLAGGGALEVARLDRVDLGWFRGAATLTGRGRGRAPAISITGGRADLREALHNLGGGGRGGAGGGGGGPVRISLDRLTLTNGIELRGLRAQLNTEGGTRGRFAGRLNGAQAVEGVLRPSGGGTAVDVRTDDMGAVLRAAGLFADARGGRGTLSLAPTDRPGVFDGTLEGQAVRLANSSNLARLLQAASVGGLIDQLTGAGVVFDTVSAEFAFLPGAGIRLDRGAAVGPQLSVTAEGAYDLRTRRIDLEGVLSPLGAVNRFFGAFLGPRRDEGLIGFTYRLIGAVDAPRVSANPLSALTPGVFREIFRRDPPER
jgi:hypothetical protein